VAAVAGCSDNSSDATDAGDADTDADTDTGDPIPLTAVDLLVVVDNSGALAQEQAILSGALFELVGGLMYPLPTSPYAAVDDLRIAATTVNMGFSSDGVNNDEYWPGAMVDACSGFGDDGAFHTSMPSQVAIQNGVIPCDDTAAQCPPGWDCVGTEEDDDTPGQGVCNSGGTLPETVIDCPELDDAPWAETTTDSANADLAAQAACLARQGTSGCGFEQQLASPARAFTREDQADFVRDNAVLAVIVMSDEEDCSMQDGQAMFAEDEAQHQDEMKVGLLCGNHPEHLFPPSHFYEAFTEARGRADAVVYLAIAGVPWAGENPEGAAACQGYGDQIAECLDQDAMQLVAEQPSLPEDLTWFFRHACSRYLAPEDDSPVTYGFPGRRFVELANDFGANGYVYSICNADWSPAFDALGAMIAGKLAP
jgi:hypothetical protein